VRVTRRAALGGAAASLLVPRAALADQKKAQSAAALTSSLRAVQTAVVAYEAIANGNLLGRSVDSTFRSFLDQESQHAKALGDALDQMGEPQPIPPRRAQIPGLDTLRSERQAVGFAIDLERHALSAYYAATRQLKDANALKTLASIMACDAQHVTVLRQLAGRPAVPHAFETGAA
jgi:rubrerythrin